jgi:hypothetical protein
VGEGRSNKALKSIGLFAGVLLAAALVGAFGGAGLRWVQEQGAAEYAFGPAPVIIVSVGELLRGGQDAVAIRALAARLADSGFLVLDAQAVLAAPPALYLQAEQGAAR